MSTDAIALCRDLPGPEYVLAALLQAGEHLRVLHDDCTGLIELLDDCGATVLQMEGPRLVQVPGESGRLLGLEAPPEPGWWVELHAPPGPHGRDAVMAVAGRLATLTRGSWWHTR